MREPLISLEEKKMTQLFAQPYDLAASGFYFETAEEYDAKADVLRNAYGDPVEEFELQFIDGEQIDCDLAKAIGINQANFRRFFELCEDLEDHEKICLFVAVGECGYGFDGKTAPDDFDVEIYEVDSMRDLAEQFVEEGIFGHIPESLQYYIDCDAIARDLAVEYSETTIAGQNIVYRCG